MGACIGKKSSKYRLNHKEPQSNIIEASQQEVQDNMGENKNKSSSPSSSKKFSVTNDVTGSNNNDDIRISTIDENGISSDLQVIINQQNIINERLSQPFPGRVISVTDTELEFELANLAFDPQVNQTLSQPLPGRVISVTDTELELELANLALEPAVNDFVKDTPTATNDSKNV